MPTPLRVLHLEDSGRDAEVIRHQLEEGGVSCHVLLVDSKDRFEAALTQEPFDLILCDYNLSGYDGIAALAYAQQARPDVPVIMISGTVGDEEAVRCVHLGATDYLLKDRLERLASAVERAIQEAQTRRARRVTEAKLQQSEQLNRSLVEHLPQGVFVKDLSFNYVFCNSTYARHLGIDPSEIAGRDDFAFFSTERAEEYRADDRQVMTEGRIKRRDERTIVAGQAQWAHLVRIPYRDQQGEIVGVLGLIEDTSERKRVEGQRERLAALVDASPDFIGYADPTTTHLKYVNKGGRTMCGIGEDEEIGTLTLGDVHPAWVSQQLAEVALPAAVRDGLWQGDGAFLHRDGHEIPVSMAVLAHRSGDGEVDFVYTVSRDITERKRAEQALRSEHDRAQRFLDAADVILLKLDLEGRIVLVNRYACSLLGWTADELLGRDWIETCVPVRLRGEFEEKRRQLLDGDLSIFESSVNTRSGEERLVEWRNRLLRDDQGHLIGSFSSGTDITERSQAVAALRAAEERMRFALQAANIGIWDLDVSTGRVQWSEILEAQYGLAPGMFGGTLDAVIECIHPDDRPSVLETLGKAMKVGADFTVQNRSIWPDGTVRWLGGAGRIYLGADGEPVRGVGISQDVTVRRQADETRARLVAIVDSTDDAIYSTRLDDTLLTWNAGAERLYGYTAAEVIGRNHALIVPAGASAALAVAMVEKAARGEAGEPLETQRVRKDGVLIDVSLTISPIMGSTGRVTGASSIARDIGNRKKAEAELQRLNLEIQLQRMRVFKATIRTVQDIVNNLLNGFQLVRFEGEGHLPVELLTLVDQMVREAGGKLKTLGDLETVNEKEMAVGMGIDYPGRRLLNTGIANVVLEPSPVRVLHLEDSPRDAALIRYQLEEGGLSCDVLLVDRKDSFEAALMQEPFDVILSDYDLHGYDAISALNYAQQARPDVPVIVISGTVGEKEGAQCLHLGATDYLHKKSLDRLVPAVQRAIQEAVNRRTRQRAEAALSDLRDAINQHAIVAVTDTRGTMTFVNDKFCDVSGYSRGELVGQDHRLINSGHHSKEFMRDLWTTIKRGDTWHGEIKNRAKNGSFFWLDTTIVPFLNDDGTPRQYMAIRGVITERKEAELALRAERDRAQRYLDTADVILLKLDLEGRIVLVNRYACSILGWTADELLGRQWIEMCLPVRIRTAQAKRFEALFEGDLSVVESPVLTRSGQERIIEWRNRLMRDDEGHVFGTFGSGTDITARLEAVDALRIGEERMRFALEAAGVGIWDLNYTTGVLDWSETLEAHYGLRPGAFGGTYEEFASHIHPDDRERLVATIAKAEKSGADFSVDHRACWSDGTVRWLRGAGRILLGQNGEPVRGVGISLDHTERRNLEDQYQQAQKMEAVGRLAGGVAHDFNNLLTVILACCEMLLMDIEPADPHQANIAIVHKAGTRAAGLTRQLLAFSRKQIIEPTLIDLNGLVADMRSMLGRLIEENVTVVLDLQPAPALILADRGQVEQIVMNLAVNARDAMPGGGTLTVRIACVECHERDATTHLALKPGPHVVLTVTDTGAGMTPQVLARLFEPFFTTKPAGQGTGLGLATVHSIVARSGGSIDVASEVGTGTTFVVYFPSPPLTEIVVTPPSVAHPRVGIPTVLVVEDEDALREVAASLLRRLGYTVLVAANADEALRLFERNASIDVLLTDVVMPGISGPELTKQLVERYPALQVVYMSGYTEEAIVRHGVLNPGVALLHKPFTSETLDRKVRDALAR